MLWRLSDGEVIFCEILVCRNLCDKDFEKFLIFLTCIIDKLYGISFLKASNLPMRVLNFQISKILEFLRFWVLLKFNCYHQTGLLQIKFPKIPRKKFFKSNIKRQIFNSISIHSTNIPHIFSLFISKRSYSDDSLSTHAAWNTLFHKLVSLNIK